MILRDMSLFQNSVSFGTGLKESGLRPAFPLKSKVAVPKLQFWNSLICFLLKMANLLCFICFN
jgi:hypothetical protein